MNTALLISLFVCHYLADFCLTTPTMIRAKVDGRRPWPILLHASIHTALMCVCLLAFGVGILPALLLMLFELATHFFIDTVKGRLTASSPLLADQRQKPYWMLYGLDQLLHNLVILTIWLAAV